MNNIWGKIGIADIIEEALSNHDERSRNIIVHRYGLKNGQKKTLAELGEQYGLTRERVRQIESAALDRIRKKIKEHESAIALLKFLEGYMEHSGKVRRGDHVARDLRAMLKNSEPDDIFYGKIRFIVEILGWPYVEDETGDWHAIWYTDKDSYKLAKKLVENLVAAKTHDFGAFLDNSASKFNIAEPLIINHLAISKRFCVGPYGDLGADHWLHVNPKTVRDKAYLVLERAGEPMHFRDIAEIVNGLDDKRRAPATVHNELIKDPRFILVKRGTYAIND